MNKNKSLKLGIIFSYITMIAGVVVSLTYTPFLLRMLGQQQYGLYNMGQAVVSYLSLTEFGLGNAVVRYASVYLGKGDKEKAASLYGLFLYIYRILSVIILVAGIVMVCFAHRVFKVSTGTEGYRQLKIIILVMVFNLAFMFSTVVYSAIITAYERFSFLKITNLIYTVLKPLVMIPLLLYGYKAIALSIVTFVLTVCLNLANVVYVKKVLKVTIDTQKKNMEFGILREVLSYSFFIFLGSIVAQLNDNADNVILGIISGEAMVAVYAIGHQLSSYIQQIPGVVSSVFFPRVTMKITQGASMTDMTRMLTKIGRIQCYFVMLLVSGFALFGKEFVSLWAGQEYEISYWIVLVLVIPASIPNMQSLGVQILQAKNRHQFRAILYVICALLNVALSIPLGIKYGPLGCAVCTGLTTFITCGIAMNWYYHVKVGLNIVQYWKNIIALCCKAMPILLIGIGLNVFIYNTTWITLIVKIVIYTCCFGIYLFLFLVNEEEKQIICNTLQRYIRK